MKTAYLLWHLPGVLQSTALCTTLPFGFMFSGQADTLLGLFPGSLSRHLLKHGITYLYTCLFNLLNEFLDGQGPVSLVPRDEPVCYMLQVSTYVTFIYAVPTKYPLQLHILLRKWKSSYLSPMLQSNRSLNDQREWIPLRRCKKWLKQDMGRHRRVTVGGWKGVGILAWQLRHLHPAAELWLLRTASC